MTSIAPSHPSTRPYDVTLHEDVRRLAAALGRIMATTRRPLDDESRVAQQLRNAD